MWGNEYISNLCWAIVQTHFLGSIFLKVTFNTMYRVQRKVLDPSSFTGMSLVRTMFIMRIMLKHHLCLLSPLIFLSHFRTCYAHAFLIFLNQPSWSAEDGKQLPTCLFPICLVHLTFLSKFSVIIAITQNVR